MIYQAFFNYLFSRAFDFRRRYDTRTRENISNIRLASTTIWVICDRLSKLVHFIALPSHYTAADLAFRFMVEIFRLHGSPKSIISDRDALFMSNFWHKLFKLRCFASENPQLWFCFLHLTEYWYNTSHHTAIGMPPFQAVYGPPLTGPSGPHRRNSKLTRGRF